MCAVATASRVLVQLPAHVAYPGFSETVGVVGRCYSETVTCKLDFETLVRI